MAEELLVDERIGEGIEIVSMLNHEGLEATGAFWIKAEHDSPWSLFVACPSMNVDRAGEAYRILGRVADEMEVMGIQAQMSDIKFVDDDSPMAREAVELARRHSARDFVVLQDSRLGGRRVAGAIVYTTKGLAEEGLRVSYRVTYHRRGDENEWWAETERGAVYRNIKAKGAVSYSTASWVGEPEGQEKFATVSVLLEMDPVFDDPAVLDAPEVRNALRSQAEKLADAMFLERWPGAKITHEDCEII